MSEHTGRTICVIGGANIDIAATYDADHDNFSDSHSGKISVSAGGVARNIAENLAHLGSRVRLFCAIGDDDFSHTLRASIDMPEIDSSACITAANMACDCYMSMFDKTGEILHAVNQMQLTDYLTPAYLSHYEQDICTAELIIADCNLSRETLEWIAHLPSRPPLFIDGVSAEKIVKINACLSVIDGLKCNHTEAAELLGLEHTAAPEALITGLRKFGIETIILSLGAEGIHSSYEDMQIAVSPPETPPHIISASGAGDALIAGYIHGMVGGLTHEKALHLGVQAAQLTLCCPSAVHPDIASLSAPENR